MRTVLRRVRYYLSSVRTLARGIRNWPALPLLALGCPVVLVLRDGLRFEARSLMDMWIVKETCLDDTYACAGRVRPGAVVVDIGAGIGDFAVWSARHLQARVVHAFEPHEGSFARLQAHLAANQVTTVVAHRVAIGAGTGPGRFLAAGEPSQSRTLPRDAREGEPRDIWSLADAFDRCGVERCDLLKLDCEGAEFSILLDGSADALSRVDQLRLEYHEGYADRTRHDLVRALEGAGFEVSDRPSPVHSHLGILVADRRRQASDARSQSRGEPRPSASEVRGCRSGSVSARRATEM